MNAIIEVYLLGCCAVLAFANAFPSSNLSASKVSLLTLNGRTHSNGPTTLPRTPTSFTSITISLDGLLRA